ncbi:IS3 family transposase [Variovorax boronicumulans]|uniref:IS3 family transposase n=1 Tax=Variovorax boronicumulans TaxID=436515 RepID=UPI003D7A7F04
MRSTSAPEDLARHAEILDPEPVGLCNSIDALEAGAHDHIHYYNHKRVKLGMQRPNPLRYRLRSTARSAKSRPSNFRGAVQTRGDSEGINLTAGAARRTPTAHSP